METPDPELRWRDRMEDGVVVKNAHSNASFNPHLKPADGVETRWGTLNRSARVWFFAAVVIGSVLAIVFHAIVGSFVVVASELSYGVLGRTLGPEVVASVWALFAFAGSAYVFYRHHTAIQGTGVWKGLRYGSAIALLWLVGMLEGVALFGNPVHAELLVGLSDAFPILIMSILLGLFAFRSERCVPQPSRYVRFFPAIFTITLAYLVGRYIGYFSGVIGSGHAEFPIQTLVWTLLMGFSVGIVFVLLGNAAFGLSSIRSATNFGIWIFGVNWFVFMIFIPLLFEGVLIDVIVRVSLDIVAVTMGCLLVLRFWHRVA